MKIQSGGLKDVLEVQLEAHLDERGFFVETFDERAFAEVGIDSRWVYESHSHSKFKGTIRGLHFQYPPHSQAKLVRALSGEIFMVYVDLRKNSPDFKKWSSLTISADNDKMLFLPRGFALGMCSLTDNSDLYYKMDDYYFPRSGETIKWDDPDLAIAWPLKNTSVVSEKDKNGKSWRSFLASTDGGLEL